MTTLVMAEGCTSAVMARPRSDRSHIAALAATLGWGREYTDLAQCRPRDPVPCRGPSLDLPDGCDCGCGSETCWTTGSLEARADPRRPR